MAVCFEVDAMFRACNRAARFNQAPLHKTHNRQTHRQTHFYDPCKQISLAGFLLKACDVEAWPMPAGYSWLDDLLGFHNQPG